MKSKRASGILLHPTSLPGRFGIGDLGDAAYRFINFLAASGQQLWQVMPLGPRSFGDSPYQALSAFAGNPLPDQATIKTAIKEWWGMEEAIDDVLVDSVFHNGYAVKVIAQLVIFEEPREPLTYQFKGSRSVTVLKLTP